MKGYIELKLCPLHDLGTVKAGEAGGEHGIKHRESALPGTCQGKVLVLVFYKCVPWGARSKGFQEDFTSGRGE